MRDQVRALMLTTVAIVVMVAGCAIDPTSRTSPSPAAPGTVRLTVPPPSATVRPEKDTIRSPFFANPSAGPVPRGAGWSRSEACLLYTSDAADE